MCLLIESGLELAPFHRYLSLSLSLSPSYFYRIINIYYVCIYIIYVIIYIFHVIISFILLTEARARHRPRRTRRPFPLFSTRVNVYSRTTGSARRGRCRERARERSHPFVPSRFQGFSLREAPSDRWCEDVRSRLFFFS